MAPWIDPKTRRPLVLIAGVALAVFLAPLALDIARALFFALPRWFRWSLGQGAILGLVVIGIRRLLHVGPTDLWPIAPLSEETVSTRYSERWVPWVLRLSVGSLVVPILANPDGYGFADWDFMLDKFEALRRTILEWGQFPWWNPWCRGGFPLAAEPSIGSMSIATPLILWLGTTIGLRIAAVLCLLIAVEGTYRLARLWTREPWSAAAVALIYGLNGGVAVDTSWGYVIAMSYCSLPWLAYHTFRIGDRFSDGLGLGFWQAFAVLNGVNYVTLYGGALTALIWLRAVRVQPREGRPRVLRHTAAAVGLFLALCGWRFVTVVFVMLDDARERASFWNETPITAIYYLLARPRADWPQVIPMQHASTFIELTAYVGLPVLLLGVASLRHGWRWWHTLTIVCAWLAIGSTAWYHPSRWIADWPVFGSTHVVTRWRFVALLGLGLAVGDVLARWRRSGRRANRLLAAALVGIIGVDYVTLAHQQLPLAFSVRPDPSLFPGPPVADIITVRSGLGYPCTMRGYGLVQGYLPMLSGYRRDARTLRRSRDEPDYRGEAWTERGPVEPSFWSPNHIEFRVEPGQEVFLNQNPGSWWLVNGRRAFPNLRCAEATVPFVVRADAEGRLDLRIRPRGLSLGIGLHLVGVAVLVLAWLWGQRSGMGESVAGGRPD